MNYILAVIIFLAMGCATPQISQQASYDNVVSDLTTFNKRLRGTLYRKVFPGDISKLNSNNYKGFVVEFSDPSESEFLTVLNDGGTVYSLAANKTHFSICFRFEIFKKVVCDQSQTAMSDSKNLPYDVDLEAEAKKILPAEE